MKNLIYINACMKSGSRTQRIATPVIEELSKKYRVETIDLRKSIYPVVDNSILEMVFMNKAFLFGVFGIMLLLYVVAVIYNRIKRPKSKNIVKVRAKVVSINQARAQTNHRDVGFDGLISGGAAIPGARFDATFINEENDETYVFTISESISNQLSVGKAGVLCFNGDEFISFGKDKEIEKIK